MANEGPARPGDQRATLLLSSRLDMIQQDIARGSGEYLSSLSVLLGVPADQHETFARSVQGEGGRLVELSAHQTPAITAILEELTRPSLQ